MSSRTKNFRRRSEAADNPNVEDKPAASAAASQTLAQSKPKTLKPADGPKRLSFADDEEDDRPAPAPRTTSSARSAAPIHKLTSSKERSAPHAPIPSNLQPQTGEYTKEKLRELQKNARSLGGSTARPQITNSTTFLDPVRPRKSEAPAEPVIVLKGLVKPPPPPPVPGGEKEGIEGEDEVSEEAEVGAANSRRFASLNIDKKTMDPSSAIPDQATINAIRAKRERMRQSRGPLPDYISLDGGGVVGSRVTEGGSSDEEENDFQGRVALFGDKKDGGIKKGVFADIEEEGVVVSEPRVVDVGFRDADDKEDDDEEERKWEEEQFRKGLGKRIDEAVGHRLTSNVLPAQFIQPQPPVLAPGMPLEPAIDVARSAEVISISQQAEIAARAFKENINKLKETHSRTLNSLMKTDENLSEALSDITSLEKSFKSASEKFVFMQRFHDFISVTCDFLQDKAPYIEELEEQMQKLHEVRASAVVERRAADTADEYNEVKAAAKAAKIVLHYLPGATNDVRESANLPVQLDEFGRDVNLQSRMDYARRTDRRKRRKAQSESKRMARLEKDPMYQHIEGESSTDESESEGDAYNSSRDELLQTAKQIFGDAADDYSKLSIVKERFEEWKKQFSSSYRDAYMSLSAPAIFSPYVRLELLEWDPLYEKTDFNDMDWHDLLFDYGLPGKVRDCDPDDADANLIPEIVEKVALPILHHEIAYCWDMLSTRRTENAVFATSLVINYIPASSEGLRELLAVVRSRLDEAISGLSIPVWRPVDMSVVPGAAQFAAYQFGMSLRLLRSVCLWKDILALPILEKLALGELLGKKLLPHVRSIMENIHDAITRTERIIASLSGVWYGPNVTADHSKKLQPLVECVMELAKRLEKRQALGVSKEEILGLARRLKKMLVELNEYDMARAILRTFQLKEAL